MLYLVMVLSMMAAEPIPPGTVLVLSDEPCGPEIVWTVDTMPQTSAPMKTNTCLAAALYASVDVALAELSRKQAHTDAIRGVFILDKSVPVNRREIERVVTHEAIILEVIWERAPLDAPLPRKDATP